MISGFGIRAPGFGFRDSGSGCRVSGFGLKHLRERPLPLLRNQPVLCQVGLCYQLGGDNISVVSAVISVPADNN